VKLLGSCHCVRYTHTPLKESHVAWLVQPQPEDEEMDGSG
jgi:hypothetical protein